MVTTLKQGFYTLIETRSQTKILHLDKKCFAWIWAEGIGEILISSRLPHKTDHLLAEGKYYLYQVEDEPDLTDLVHLELATGPEKWQGYLLPTGLPTSKNKRRRIIPTTERITPAIVMQNNLL